MINRPGTPSRSVRGFCGRCGLPQCASAQSPADAARDTTAARARVAFAHALPRLDGGHLEVKLVEVVYGPGQASSPHSHPCPVIGYVTEGALRTQVKGEPEVIYRAGQSFY